MYKWARTAPEGYEVSSRGDKRFSALNARLKDGRTIEEAYQLDVKGYRSLGWSWLKAKKDHGQNAPIKLNPEQLWRAYLGLWKQWATENPALIEDLRHKATGHTLTDCFAFTPVSQARALAEILNEKNKNET